jgi:hypothetical protein
MKTNIKILVMALGLALLSFTATAEVYRWVDAQGRVHYSDRPDSENAKPVGIYSRPSNPEAIAKRTQAEKEQWQQADTQAQKQSADAAAGKAVTQDMAKIQKERCTKAKEDYRVATESQRLYRVGKSGEREYLTDAEITEARVNTRKALAEACKQK